MGEATYWRTVPFNQKKQKVEYHDYYDEALRRAKVIANKTGDWCAVEAVQETADGWTSVGSVEFVTGDKR